MLTRFSVSNFKGFDKEFVFDLKETNGYTFNNDSIKNGVVNNAIVYGPNGVGKSNLGFAIFDIVGHLTDKYKGDLHYSEYLNALNGSGVAEFHYEFQFDSCVVSYQYRKSNHETIVFERFSINGKELAFIDKSISGIAEVNFKGSENLKRELTDQNISLLKYIKSNSILDKNNENDCLERFFEYVDSMLFFRSLHDNSYMGLEIGSAKIDEDIIEKGNVSDLEKFLNLAGIDCKLVVIKESGKNVLAFDFNGNAIKYYKIASSGTRSLILFYYWLQRIREKSKVSLLFIDEFDAFYHHELSLLIINELKKIGVQFILTTHDTSLISNELLRPDCYFLMNKKSIKPLSRSTSKELREAHNLEKMYKAGLFNVK